MYTYITESFQSFYEFSHSKVIFEIVYICFPRHLILFQTSIFTHNALLTSDSVRIKRICWFLSYLSLFF
jgi:hypothetical protein